MRPGNKNLTSRSLSADNQNDKTVKVSITHYRYDIAQYQEQIINDYSKLNLNESADQSVNWYDIQGYHDTDLISYIDRSLDIHSLIIAGVTAVSERPKFDEYPKGIFIILKNLTTNKTGNKIKSEQIAIFFRKGLVITFHQKKSNIYDNIVERIKTENTRIRQRGADYLVYALIDAIVDQYFVVLERIEARIEDLEERLLANPDSSIKSEMHKLKKELLVVRRAASPLREAIGKFIKSDSDHVDENTIFFIRDLYDHNLQVIENIESNRDLITGLQDLLNSEVGYKTNQVMQLLTLVSTIFIPLTFIAGIYGMNFENMPELSWQYGYFMILILMFSLFFGLLFFFKKKKWI